MAPTPPIRRTSPTEALLGTVDLVEEFEDSGEGRDCQRENPGGHSESNRSDYSRRSSAASDFGFERRFSGKRVSVQPAKARTLPGNKFFQPRPDLFENVDILTHSLEALPGGQLCRDLAREEVTVDELLPRVLFMFS